jgi:hypothetical protein
MGDHEVALLADGVDQADRGRTHVVEPGLRVGRSSWWTTLTVLGLETDIVAWWTMQYILIRIDTHLWLSTLAFLKLEILRRPT